MNALAVQVSHRSCLGSRSRNEDRLAVEQLGPHWCLVLSDGAGGHSDGALASRLAVERVLEGFRSRPPADPTDLGELLLDAHDTVVAAQRELRERKPTAGMYATVVALVIDTACARALWGHVGDSRLYHWRGGMLAAVTRDDSVMQAMIESGAVDRANLPTHAHGGVLLAALGSGDEIRPHVAPPLQLLPGDSFLLCSDGWWHSLEPEGIETTLAQAATPQAWLDAMHDATIARADPRQDNHSAIACWIRAAPAAALG